MAGYQPEPANFGQPKQPGHAAGHEELVFPPLTSMHKVRGYENVNFKAG